jgi:hypothetical protein
VKKIFAVVALSALVASMSYAGMAPKTGINGSMHDINAAAGYTDDALQRTCVFCHTPHNAITSPLAPLWNHEVSNQNIPQYTWQSPANAAAINILPDPLTGPSRLCQSCHDGVTAVDSHGSAASTGGGSTIMQSSYVDALGNTAKRYIEDLTVTHPIGFSYDEAFTGRPGELVPATSGFIADGNSVALLANNFDTRLVGGRVGITLGTKTINDTLYGGLMTCASCHDVHNSVNASPEPGHTYNYFLYAQEEGSAICLSCHVK